MSTVFGRSWNVTKLTFKVIKEDKELVIFPILSGIFSLIFIIAMAIPSIIPMILQATAEDGGGFAMAMGIINYIMIFLIYLGLAVIATFFNVCVVFIAKTRFEGGNATAGQAISFAFSKMHLIFMWGLVSATVGLILKILNNIAERMGLVGQILLKILIAILGMAWSIVTLFVVPAMVYNNIGPFGAIKSSVDALKKTWGEALIKHIGLGIMQFIFSMLGILFLVTGVALAIATQSGWFIGIGLLLFIIYIVILSILFSVANTIYNTALYAYANTGKIPMGYDEDTIKNAFQPKESRGLFGGSKPAQNRPMNGPQM